MKRFGTIFFAMIGLLATAGAAFAEPEPDPAVRAAVLRWPAGGIRLSLSSSLFKSGPNIKLQSDVAGAFSRAAARWSAVADIYISTGPSSRLSASPAGIKGDGISLVSIAPTPENILLFGSDTSIAAKTRLFVDAKGTITEADIVLNPFAQFSTDGSYGSFDLETVLTHEIGHVLGLKHSPVMGSIMHSSVDPNSGSVFGGVLHKELSGEDAAMARTIYGAPESSVDCCGTVAGKVAGGKDTNRGVVVIYDVHGRVAGTGAVGPLRDFSVGGLESGRYTAVLVDPRMQTGDRQLGSFSLDPGETVQLTGKVKQAGRAPSVAYIGDRGPLGTSPVVLSPGAEVTLTIGGKGISADSIDLSSSGAAIRVEPGSLTDQEYSDEVSAIQFRVVVSEFAKPGSYSLYAHARNGGVASLLGAIVIEAR